MKAAVKADLLEPIQLQPGDGSYQAFLANETRYSSLARKSPDRAVDLFAKSEAVVEAHFDHLQELVELYKCALPRRPRMEMWGRRCVFPAELHLRGRAGCGMVGDVFRAWCDSRPAVRVREPICGRQGEIP